MLADIRKQQQNIINHKSLNPCFTGICSPTQKKFQYEKRNHCLNPCFTGICSPTLLNTRPTSSCSTVLILVLLEYARRQDSIVKEFIITTKVLILVLLEYARRQGFITEKQIMLRLNPCFTGICSPTNHC